MKVFRKHKNQTLISFLRTDLGTALVITIIWKCVLLMIGYGADHYTNGAQSLLHHTIHWDANWYMEIIGDHYQTNLASAAFYPLFPLLVGCVHTVSFGLITVPFAGQIVNTFAVWASIVALIGIGRRLLGEQKKLWLVFLLLSAPTAFFMHVFYSEAVFMAVAFWAYLFALRRQWLGMGITLGILTAARLPSLLFIGLCAIEFIRAYDWRLHRIFNKNILYFLVVPAGFVVFGVYLYFVQDDFFGMFNAYRHTTDWPYQIFNPNIFETVGRISMQVIKAFLGYRPFDTDMIINHIIPLVSLGFLLLSSLFLVIKKRREFLPLGVFGIVAFFMFTLNSNVVSVHRYILPCLTVYVAMALPIKTKYRLSFIGVCIAGLFIQLALYVLFVQNIFVG